MPIIASIVTILFAAGMIGWTELAAYRDRQSRAKEEAQRPFEAAATAAREIVAAAPLATTPLYEMMQTLSRDPKTGKASRILTNRPIVSDAHQKERAKQTA